MYFKYEFLLFLLLLVISLVWALTFRGGTHFGQEFSAQQYRSKLLNFGALSLENWLECLRNCLLLPLVGKAKSAGILLQCHNQVFLHSSFSVEDSKLVLWINDILSFQLLSTRRSIVVVALKAVLVVQNLGWCHHRKPHFLVPVRHTKPHNMLKKKWEFQAIKM